MMVDDMNKSLVYYRDVLGFDFLMAVSSDKNDAVFELDESKNLIWARMKKDNIELMFQEKQSFLEDVPVSSDIQMGASISLYFEIEDVDAYYDKIKDKAEIIKGINTAWYGMKEFYLKDCNGYILCFASRG